VQRTIAIDVIAALSFADWKLIHFTQSKMFGRNGTSSPGFSPRRIVLLPTALIRSAHGPHQRSAAP